jgi:muramoyltetrapeptide carboxypeptidase
MIQPTPLIPGDLIYITAPAKITDPKTVLFAKEYLEKHGFNVLVSAHCFGNHHYFSGTEEERLSDLQFGIDHPDVRAILCARGGYGSIRILDRINWANVLLEPKWVIGFSDITVFHHRLQKLGIQSIHATMPISFQKNTDEALVTLLESITGKFTPYVLPPNKSNKIGKATGNLIGGNLSIVYSMLGTNDQYDFENSILFLEDVGEPYYQVERMIFALSKAGVFEKIKGLIIGGMTDLEDTVPPLGRSIEEIILEQLQFSNMPVIFNFPSGHIDDNRALVFGKRTQICVNDNETTVSYLNQV